MYKITEHSTTLQHTYQDVIDRAIHCMRFYDSKTCYRVVNEDTGVLLFEYTNGNFTYVDGIFSRDIVYTIIERYKNSSVANNVEGEDDEDDEDD